jgi:hypothetical protein
MPLPLKEKTWEFDANRVYQHVNTGHEFTGREMHGTFKNQMIGASHTAYQGTITEITPNVTYQLVSSDRGGDPTVIGSEDFTAALIGKRVEFVGATSGGNDGVFEITAVPGVDTIQYACTTGVAEAFIGSIRVSNGKFTSGAGSTPATEILTFTGNAGDGETVTTFDGLNTHLNKTYTFRTVLVGGNIADEVLIGGSASDSLDNLIAAINRDAGEGTTYGGLTRDNFLVSASAGAGDTMDIVCKTRGVRGNAFTLGTTVTGASWGAASPSGGADGYFPAWRCKGSHGTSKGSAMDGIDRWQTVATDIASSTSGTRGWFVFQNDVTGAEFLFWGHTSSNSFQWQRGVVSVSPELGFTGGTSSTRPTAVDQFDVSSSGNEFWGHTAPGDQTWLMHMMHSDDGEDTRFWGMAFNNNYFLFMSETAKDATKNGALIPWNGRQNILDWTEANGNASTIPNYNDGAQMRGTIDKDASAGGHYEAAFYLSSEHYVSATVMENFVNVRDELANEFIMMPVGLTASAVGIRGRHGRMSDFWYTNATTLVQVPQGSTYPSDGTHQFVKLGHFVFPWNGTTPMRVQ